MKTVLSSIVTSSVLAAFAIAPPARRYTITDLGTLGGTYSYAYRINNAGVVAGGIATSTQIGVNQTASLWYGRHLIDLGTLDLKKCPTCNSAAGDPNGGSESAMVSETCETDPNGEDFCAFGTHCQCLGAIWTPSKVLDFEAEIWGPNGAIRELSPLPGDTVGFTFGIDDKGQAVGVSGLCSNTSAPPVSSFNLEPCSHPATFSGATAGPAALMGQSRITERAGERIQTRDFLTDSTNRTKTNNFDAVELPAQSKPAMLVRFSLPFFGYGTEQPSTSKQGDIT